MTREEFTLLLVLQGYYRAYGETYKHKSQHKVVVSYVVEGYAYICATNREAIKYTYEELLHVLGECYG